MKKEINKKRKKKLIDKQKLYRPWHNAFVFILKELLPTDLFKFITNFSVGNLPLVIDVIILRKNENINKNVKLPIFFSSFLEYEYTIIEYKSPEDYFTYFDFIKLNSYANMFREKKRIEISESVSIVGICSRTEKNFEHKMEADGYVFNKIEAGFYKLDKKLYDGYIIKIDELELESREMILAYFVRNEKKKEKYIEFLMKDKDKIELELYLLRLLKYFKEVSMSTTYQGKTKERLKKDLEKAIIESGILKDISLEEVLKNYNTKEVLKNYNTEEILKNYNTVEIELFLKKMKNN